MKVRYSDFWNGFVEDVKNKNGEWYFGEFLPSLFNIEIVNSNPDTLIYSVFGKNYRNSKYRGVKKVAYSAENNKRNFKAFRKADFTISHHIPGEGTYGDLIQDNTHLRMPIYLRVFGPDRMKKLGSFNVEKTFNEKKKFCCLVTRNKNADERKKIFKKIHEDYKRVDSAGKVFNNMKDNWNVPGDWLNLKSFAKRYKFMIAAENTKVIGYNSEKLYNALRCKTVPVYWGNPEVENLFNPEAFVNVQDFNSFDKLIEYIEYLDNNDKAYKEMLAADPFPCSIDEHPVYNEDVIEQKTKEFFT